MKKWLWVIPVVIAVILAAGLTWYFMTDWTTTVGICYRDATDDSNRSYRQALEQALQDMGYEVIAVDSDNDQAKQLNQLTQLKDRTAVLLIVEPVMTSATDELLTTLQALQLPVVLTGKAPEIDLSDLQNMTFVGYDNTVPGILQAQLILDLPDGGDLNGDGVVSCLMLQGPEDDLDALTYTESCKKAMKLGPLGTEILTLSCGEGGFDSGKVRCAAQLRKFGKDIEVILCSDDAIALGAAEAVTDYGLQIGTDVYLFGNGGTAEALAAVKGGALNGTVLALGDEKLQTVLDAACSLMAGEPVAPYYFLEYIAITAENVDSYLGQ